MNTETLECLSARVPDSKSAMRGTLKWPFPLAGRILQLIGLAGSSCPPCGFSVIHRVTSIAGIALLASVGSVSSQNCAYVAGNYSIVEQVSVKVILLDSGNETIPCTAMITGTIPITQSGCSVTLSASGAQIQGCDGIDYLRSRQGTVNGTQLTLNGTLYHPLPSAVPPDTQTSTASGSITGNRIRLSGSGAVTFYGTFGKTRITWTSSATLDRILDLPIIQVQPTNRTVYAGATVSFAVGATHTKPFTYQWRRNGVNVPGENQSVLTLRNVNTAQAGIYSVVLSNYSGTVASVNAQLTINPLPPPTAPWSEGWQNARLGIHFPTADQITLLSSDRGSWYIGDTASEDCSTVENWVEIISQSGNKMLKLYSATNSDCAMNIWVDYNKTLNPSFSIPLLPRTEISLFEQGWLENPEWNGVFPSLILPPADCANLKIVDSRANMVVYIFQRAPNYLEHALTNGPSAFGYLEVFLDPAGGKFTRDLYADFARIAGVAGVGESIQNIVFELASPGWAVLDDLRIGQGLMDHTPPTLAITNPAPSGVRVSTAVVDLQGWARDNDRVTNVAVSVNGAAYVPATLLNNGTNWVLTGQTLVPGTNSVRAFASDVSGNVSPVVSNHVVYVVSDQVVLVANPPGGGTVTGVADGQWLEIGRSYLATARADSAGGYGFTHWLCSTNGLDWVTSTVTALTFTAQSNLVITATFVDIQRPTLLVSAPTANQRWSNSVFTVRGSTRDNGPMEGVFYQLNGGNWTGATSLNSWTNWNAEVTLTPGPNTLRTYAVDRAGNPSTTNAVTMNYVETFALVEYFHPISVGNQWVYQFTHHSLTPTNSVIRIDSVSHPLTCYRGRTAPIPYVTNVISLYSSYCDYDNGTEVNIDDTWYEYYTTSGGVRIWGSDDDPGTIPDPDQERLRVDGGALLGDRLAVGQTITGIRDFYEDGKFLGAIPITVQLVSHTSVTVPAGTFADCLHLRVTHTIEGSPRTFEEWWAKGIGMIRKTRTSSGGFPQLYELTEFTIASPVPVSIADANEAMPSTLASPSAVVNASVSFPRLQLENVDRSSNANDGSLRLRLTAPSGSLVVVEHSADLQRWVPIQTNAITTESVLLSVPMNQYPQQFFRARISARHGGSESDLP